MDQEREQRGGQTQKKMQPESGMTGPYAGFEFRGDTKPIAQRQKQAVYHGENDENACHDVPLECPFRRDSGLIIVDHQPRTNSFLKRKRLIVRPLWAGPTRGRRPAEKDFDPGRLLSAIIEHELNDPRVGLNSLATKSRRAEPV